MSDNNLSRKNFLKFAGLSSVVATGLAGCEINSIPPPEPDPGLNLGPDPRPDDFAVYIGSGDTGLLNFIYIVEQMEAAFFTRVMNNPYPNMTGEEERIFADIRQHDVAHRDFYKALLGDNAASTVNFEFYKTNFNNRESVLKNALLLEDTTVSMYNTFSQLFDNIDYIDILLKIFSVEGRHATAMRNLLRPNSTFFLGNGIISSNGLDTLNSPLGVVIILFPFVIENVDIRELPAPEAQKNLF